MSKASIRQRGIAALATIILVVLALPGMGLRILPGCMPIGATAMFNVGASLLQWRRECEVI